MAPPPNDKDYAEKWFDRIEEDLRDLRPHVQDLRIKMAGFTAQAEEWGREREQWKKDRDTIIGVGVVARLGKVLLPIAQAATLAGVAWLLAAKDSVMNQMADLRTAVETRTFVPTDYREMVTLVRDDHAAITQIKVDMSGMREQIGKIKPVVNVHTTPSTTVIMKDNDSRTSKKSEYQQPTPPGTIHRRSGLFGGS